MSRDLNKADLDNYITGHWGEDQFRYEGDDEAYEGDAGDENEPKCQTCSEPLYLHERPCEHEFSDDAMVGREREAGLR